MARGRPQHTPTDKQRSAVESMVAAGLIQSEMCSLLGICENTLRKCYSDELAYGKAKMVSSLFGKAYKSAMGDGPDARSDRQFLLKTRGGYSEKQELNATVDISGGVNVKTTVTVIDVTEDNK